MSEVLVVVEDGRISEIVSDDDELLVHIVRKDTFESERRTETIITNDSAEVSKVVDEGFDFDAYAKKQYNVDIERPTIH